MADKEVTLFVVDVSKYMAEESQLHQSTTLEWCLEYVWDKLGIKIMAARKTDYIAVLAVGSTETDNPLGNEESYKHIRVVMSFPRRNSEEFRSYTFAKSHVDVMMSELKPSKSDQGDLLSAVIIGIQMITDFCLKLKFKKNLILITKGELETDFTDAEPVAVQIKEQEINLSVIGAGFDDADYGIKEEGKSARKRYNEGCFKQLCEDTDGIFATYDEVEASLKIPRVKPVRPVTTFRGFITLGDPQRFNNIVAIPVERYPKTKQAKAPVATKFSMAAETRFIVARASQGQAEDAPENTTHQVYPARTYRLQDGEELADTSMLEKGYAYGKTVIPISKADEDFLKFDTAAGYSILGFINCEECTRYMAMGEASIIISQKTNHEASLALSSFIHALFEAEVYALARFVRKDNVPPVMVLLAPHLETEYEALLEVSLPFAEDVRQHKFASLERVKTSSGEVLEKHRYLPNEKLNNAMSEYLDSIELGSAVIKEDGAEEKSEDQEEEQLAPEDTFSYGVHRIMQAIMYRAFHHSTKPVPDPADVIIRNSRILPDMLQNAQPKLERLIKAADTKKVPLRAASKRKRGQEQLEPVKTEIDLDDLLGDGQDGAGGEEQTGLDKGGRTASIGQAHPAQDFETMMKDDGLIDAAFQQVQPVLLEMVQYSSGNQNYQNTLEAFKAFRRHAIQQEETELFNFFFERFQTKMSEENRNDFLSLLESNKVGKITDEEAMTNES